MPASPRSAYEAWLRNNGAPWLVVRSGVWRRATGSVGGLVRIVAFALSWFVTAIMRSGGSMLAVVPLLLIAVLLSFFSTETWQTVGDLHGLPIVAVIALLAGLAALFVAKQSKPDLQALAAFAPGEVAATLPGSVPAPAEPLPAPPALGRDERANLLLVSVLAQVIAATIIGIAVAAFFIVFGILTISPEVTDSWVGHAPRVFADARLGGHHYAITSQLLRVAAFLGAFAGFYFIVTSTADARMRQVQALGHDEHLRQVLAVRAAYLATG